MQRFFSSQDAQLVSMRANGVIATPTYRDVRPDRIVRTMPADMSELHCSADMAPVVFDWLTTHGFTAVMVAGQGVRYA